MFITIIIFTIKLFYFYIDVLHLGDFSVINSRENSIDILFIAFETLF